MNKPRNRAINYKENFILILFFLVLLGIAPVSFIYFGFRFEKRAVLNKFNLNKSLILDEISKSYNHLLFDQIPELSYYNGILDTATFGPIAENYLNQYTFLDSIKLYRIQVNHHFEKGNLQIKHLNFQINNRSIFFRTANRIRTTTLSYLNKKNRPKHYPMDVEQDCMEPMLNYSRILVEFDSTQNLSKSAIFEYFYRISESKITYINVPGNQALKSLHDMMNDKVPSGFSLDQNLVVFTLNPYRFQLMNPSPDLYESILLRPLSFDSLSNNSDYITTSLVLPRAFSNYQVYFISSKSFLLKRELSEFLIPSLIFLSIYLLTGIIAFLIFRNLSINKKLFKLQYDFINNFTHEFKTPVSVIKITGEALLGNSIPLKKELEIYGKILGEEADKLNNLINRLLSFTQLENNRVKVVNKELNLIDFLEELKEEYLLQYPGFQIEYSLGKLAWMKTDKVLLNSIFSNLIENAYKYSKPGKKYLSIVINREKRWIYFKFKDQGIGIKQEDLDLIFKKFYKVDNELNIKGSIGIGLAFSKEIIELMKGQISVTSQLGIGSEFTIKLPLIK